MDLGVELLEFVYIHLMVKSELGANCNGTKHGAIIGTELAAMSPPTLCRRRRGQGA
jgi:hypothetical protein